jgi:site-specific DNA-methyltransferase (adenine-specific)
MENILYYGDNLDILQRYIKDESVDLVYLDPPFNSNATYNVLFKEKDGSEAASQIQAFDDTWTWGQDGEAVFAEIQIAGGRVADCLGAFRLFLGPCDMLAYLVMMAPRLMELRRVMKPTASIYLHCDPSASHYLKMLMDAIFGPENFQNEIVWCYKSRPQSKKYYGWKHDVILFYAKTEECFFNWKAVVRELSEETKKKYKHIDEKGRLYRLEGRGITGSPIKSAKDVPLKWEKEHPELVVRDYLDEKIGVAREDWWTDIDILNQAATERLGYPTQKPMVLLERIISSSCPEKGIVLDPFCGCGTTIAAAQKLGRAWIGIDITFLAITLMKVRLRDSFGDAATYKVLGEPVSVPDAERLAESDPYQFQWWALGLVGARPADQKKGADKGIDGHIIFMGDKPGTFESVILSVKAGKTQVSHVRDLLGVLDREKAVIGVLISMQEPTGPMKMEAATAGHFESGTWNKKYPKVQLLTVADILSGKQIEMPPIRQVNTTFKKAPKVDEKEAEQKKLFIG